jgi:formyl-CoA transferase
VLYDLVRTADVFLTSFRQPALEKLQIDWEHIHEINPRIVYARSSGYGPRGPDANTPAFDLAATWARAGLLQQMTSPDAESPSLQPGSVGDLSGGLNLASGVAAALLKRERSGEGMQVDVSLFHVGMWIMAQSIGAAAVGIAHRPFGRPRTEPRNPLANSYRTLDNRWIVLCMVQPDKDWPDFCRHIDRPELIDDPRFVDIFAREKNSRELVAVLDEIFKCEDLGEWRRRLATMSGSWAPAQTAEEITRDVQALENGYFPEVVGLDGDRFRSVASPIQYGGEPIGELRAMPEHGQHTEEVLLSLGLDWDDLGLLKEAGAIN